MLCLSGSLSSFVYVWLTPITFFSSRSRIEKEASCSSLKSDPYRFLHTLAIQRNRASTQTSERMIPSSTHSFPSVENDQLEDMEGRSTNGVEGRTVLGGSTNWPLSQLTPLWSNPFFLSSVDTWDQGQRVQARALTWTRMKLPSLPSYCLLPKGRWPKLRLERGKKGAKKRWGYEIDRCDRRKR